MCVVIVLTRRPRYSKLLQHGQCSLMLDHPQPHGKTKYSYKQPCQCNTRLTLAQLSEMLGLPCSSPPTASDGSAFNTQNTESISNANSCSCILAGFCDTTPIASIREHLRKAQRKYQCYMISALFVAKRDSLHNTLTMIKKIESLTQFNRAFI